MSMNLRHMGFNEALDAAKQRSGLTNEAIANRSSLSTAAVSRYFNKYDDYTPSPELIPLLCRALGNTIIADWIAAQVEDMHGNEHHHHGRPHACGHAGDREHGNPEQKDSGRRCRRRTVAFRGRHHSGAIQGERKMEQRSGGCP